MDLCKLLRSSLILVVYYEKLFNSNSNMIIKVDTKNLQ